MKKEEILKFYIKFRLFIFPFVVALSCLILIAAVLYPQTEKLILNQKLHNDLTSRSQFLEAKAATLENIDETDLSKKLTVALSSYPLERDFGNIVGILRSTANANGFNLNGLIINPVADDGSGGTQKYSVRMEVLGPENLLVAFTTGIESQPRIMKVGTIDVSKNAQGGSVNVLLSVEVLYASSPQNFGGPDSQIPLLSANDEALLTTLASYRGVSQPSAPAAVQFGPRGKSNPFE